MKINYFFSRIRTSRQADNMKKNVKCSLLVWYLMNFYIYQMQRYRKPGADTIDYYA